MEVTYPHNHVQIPEDQIFLPDFTQYNHFPIIGIIEHFRVNKLIVAHVVTQSILSLVDNIQKCFTCVR